MTSHIPDLASVDLPTALNRVAACLLATAMAWAGLAALLASWAPTARWARAITPRTLRVTLCTAVSSALAVSPARAASDLDGLPLPTRGVTASAEATGDHVVAAGESLWAISAEALPPEAGPAAVAHDAAAWYRRNRVVIGPDPNLIHPGQVLLAPEGTR